VHQRPQPADDREFFFLPYLVIGLGLGARAPTSGRLRMAAPSGHQSGSWQENVARPHASCGARYRVGSAHTPTINQHVYGGGTHAPILPGVIQMVGSPGTWIYAKCAIRISHSGCWLATEEVDTFCAVSGSERVDPRVVVPKPPAAPHPSSPQPSSSNH
jgi:hypothetical protein